MSKKRKTIYRSERLSDYKNLTGLLDNAGMPSPPSIIKLVDHEPERLVFVNSLSQAMTEALADQVSIAKRIKALGHASDAVAIFEDRHGRHG